MRKPFKALVGVLAAAATLLTGGLMASTASAAEADFHTLSLREAGTPAGSVTVKNVKDGQMYKVYQMFTLETNTDYDAFKYKAATGWDDFLNGDTAKQYVTVKDGYVTWTKSYTGDKPLDTDVQAFAQAALDYVHEHSTTITAVGHYKRTANETGEATEDKSDNATYTAASGDESATVKFQSLTLGYYLVESTTGALVSLSTTKPDAEAEDKNDVPTVDKQVQEDSKQNEANGGWGDLNDAEIGETVNFKTTIQVKAGAVNYVLHDKMDPGLVFNSESGVNVSLIKKAETATSDVDEANYTVLTDSSVSETTGEKCTFEVKFDNDYIATLSAGDQLVVTYSATVDANAVIGGNGNLNKTWLGYGDNMTTTQHKTTTYVWEFGVEKYTGASNDKTYLAGATFTLSKDDGTGSSASTALSFKELADTDARQNVYQYVANGGEGTLTTITTDSTGKFILSGLDSGTYWLTETTAPSGYNKLEESIKVDIGSDGTVMYTLGNTATNADKQNPTVSVLNQAGSELPGTGGMGTTVLYAAGAVIVIAAALGLTVVLRKRQSLR